MDLYDFLRQKLAIGKQEISQFAFSAPKKYKLYTIPKRTSGSRLIAHPSRELKVYQRALVDFLSLVLPIHAVAQAYVKGKGIKTNATLHIRNQYLLKMDFSNFFNNITPDLLLFRLMSEGIDPKKEDVYLLKNLLFCNIGKKDGGVLRLSVGAPSSPFVSNSIMYPFDSLLSEHCRGKGIVYSRYADDLTFSTNKKGALFEVPSFVENILFEVFSGRVLVNHGKTVFSSKAHNRHVTGITLTNEGRLSIGRKRKRLISSLIHKYSINLLETDEIMYLRGLYSFALDVEPDFGSRMQKKYSFSVVDSLVRGSNEKL